MPITDTRILCSSKWSELFSLMSFYNSCFCSLCHLVRITPLTQKPHACTNSSVISTTKTSNTAFPTTKAPQLILFCLFPSFFVVNWSTFFHENVFDWFQQHFCRSCKHKGTDIHRRYVLMYSTCFWYPLCDIYRNMGTCVIQNPDCGFEVDSWLSANVYSLQYIGGEGAVP